RYRELVGTTTCPPPSVLDRVQRVRTHLNRFTRGEADALMYHGYLLTDAFLWARSAHLPLEYRRDGESPRWRVNFNTDSTERMIAATSYIRSPLVTSSPLTVVPPAGGSL